MRTIVRWTNGQKIETTAEATPFGPNRAKHILDVCGTFSSYECQMTDGEMAHVMNMQDTMPVSASFPDALLRLSQGE